MFDFYVQKVAKIDFFISKNSKKNCNPRILGFHGGIHHGTVSAKVISKKNPKRLKCTESYRIVIYVFIFRINETYDKILYNINYLASLL